MEQKKYGLLLNDTIKIQRQYFEEMVSLIGVYCVYMAPKKDKHWTTYAEIESNYEQPEQVGCIFQEHPDQKTMKMLGWVSELQNDASIISVPYSLKDKGLQVGALFIVPSAMDNTNGRLFRVVEISNEMVYPSSITCKLVPEYEDTFDKSLFEHSDNSFNLLREEGDGTLW